MKKLVLYHNNCADGFCAAWICHSVFGDDADYVGVNYGQEPPDVSNREVYIVDFSYKRDVMSQIISKAKTVCILDHHKTAAAELDFLTCSKEEFNNGTSVPYIKLDMSKSGARLTWEHFYPNAISPWLVNYTEDRDLWRWELPNSKEINAALASYPINFVQWDIFCQDNRFPDLLVKEGTAIVRYKNQLVTQLCNNAVEIEVDGHKVLSVNTGCLFSEVARQVAKGRPFGISWFVRADGKEQYSLRSEEGGIDVSEIAKKRGGGGHVDAAGFERAKL